MFRPLLRVTTRLTPIALPLALAVLLPLAATAADTPEPTPAPPAPAPAAAPVQPPAAPEKQAGPQRPEKGKSAEGAPPLYATCVIAVLVMPLNISAAICSGLPSPDEA